MDKFFIITFRTGETVTGKAEDIVTRLRETSYFEKGLTNRQYRRNFARRHGVVHGWKLRWWSDLAFVKSLKQSPNTFSFLEYSK